MVAPLGIVITTLLDHVFVYYETTFNTKRITPRYNLLSDLWLYKCTSKRVSCQKYE